MEHKTKIIYSLKLCEFLLEQGCVLDAILKHPFKRGYSCWRFVDDEHLQESISKFMEQREKENS